MKISKSSLHYRLVNFVFDNPNRNLCVYFWQVVWSSFFVPFMFICLICGILGGLLFLSMPVWTMFYGSFDVLAGMAAVLDVGLLLTFWYLYRKHKYPEKEPGVIGSYIRAKKEKICPTIDFSS